MSDVSSAQSPATSGLAGLLASSGDKVLALRSADVGLTRERLRYQRLARVGLSVSVVAGVLGWRELSRGSSPFLPLPTIDPFLLIIIVFFGALMLMAIIPQFVTGRSPHVVYRADQITTRLDDVVGIDPVKDDVIRSLNLFLSHKAFSQEMGGRPRRGLLFEGAPGTGKTHLARAMAAEAGVPFLFVSGTSFQTVWQGQSSKKIRSFFKALRKAALKEGGAIGFIEEIDVIAASRSGVSAALTPMAVAGCSGTAILPSTYASTGVVRTAFSAGGDTSSIINELLVQMQSFDALSGKQRVRGWFVDRINLLLPLHRHLKRPEVTPANVLLIAATNRADSLDPALLRPGRFDRRLTFQLPSKAGRRELIDYFLTKKAHTAELNDERREALSGLTQGYTPVMIEHLFDEALVNAVRRAETAMTWADVEHARLTEEVGLGQPVGYTDHELRLIATHEAGHATVAWLVAPERRLEILTIIKRNNALGMLAHGDREDVFTRSRKELLGLIQVSLGGQCAEQIFFGDVSTGPGGDLLYATNCAAEMVGAHGMDDSLVSFAAIANSGFSDTNIVGRVLADSWGRERVGALLAREKVEVMALLQANKHLVEALRDALVGRHELIGKEITDVLEAAAARPAMIDLRTESAAVDRPA